MASFPNKYYEKRNKMWLMGLLFKLEKIKH